MTSEVHFKGMERSVALETYLLKRLEPLLTDFLHRHDWHARVWLVTENSRFKKGVPVYRCEIDVRFPPKKEIFIEKSSVDMYQSINRAIERLKVAAAEYSKREIDAKRSRRSRLNLRPISVPQT